MRITIIGATGFIGRELYKELLDSGHRPVAITRDDAHARKILGNRAEIMIWDGKSVAMLADAIKGSDAIINLSGKNLSSGRWTAKRKKQISESRVKTGQLLCEAIVALDDKPTVLIQASACGLYGINVPMPADESFPAGKGFLADLIIGWEDSVRPAAKVIERVVWMRNGLVLGKGGSLMVSMLLPFRLIYSGAVIGPGTQQMSWIHMNDLIAAIKFFLENKNTSGPYNIASPAPVLMKDFIKIIGSVIGRPVWFKVPSWVLMLVFGHMAKETILASQNIYPAKLLKQGFRFKYTSLNETMENILID
jgi:uncharacterized protein (TIGR01777 family)